MRKHPLHRIALMQCHSCLVPFGLTPFGPREPRSGRRGDTCPEPHTCTCSALQVRCRWERGTAPLPPSRSTPLGLRLSRFHHALRERGEGDEGLRRQGAALPPLASLGKPPLPRQTLVTQ